MTNDTVRFTVWLVILLGVAAPQLYHTGLIASDSVPVRSKPADSPPVKPYLIASPQVVGSTGV